MKLDSAGLMLGLVGNICLAFLFFPVNRGSLLLQLVGLTSESSIKYHIWLGHTAMALFTAHGLCYTIFWARTHQILNVCNTNLFFFQHFPVGVRFIQFNQYLILPKLTLYQLRYCKCKGPRPLKFSC